METAIVLAMHGAPPTDFPRAELVEFFDLHARLEHPGPGERAEVAARHDELEAKMRAWPRTELNDPFYAGSVGISQSLANTAGMPVILGFNEFCAPSLREALDQAGLDFRRVVVITPMLTPGGEHAGADIPSQIEQARARNRRTQYIYAWPFETADIAAFLAAQVARKNRVAEGRGPK